MDGFDELAFGDEGDEGAPQASNEHEQAFDIDDIMYDDYKDDSFSAELSALADEMDAYGRWLLKNKSVDEWYDAVLAKTGEELFSVSLEKVSAELGGEPRVLDEFMKWAHYKEYLYKKKVLKDQGLERDLIDEFREKRISEPPREWGYAPGRELDGRARALYKEEFLKKEDEDAFVRNVLGEVQDIRKRKRVGDPLATPGSSLSDWLHFNSLKTSTPTLDDEDVVRLVKRAYDAGRAASDRERFPVPVGIPRGGSLQNLHDVFLLNFPRLSVEGVPARHEVFEAVNKTIHEMHAKHGWWVLDSLGMLDVAMDLFEVATDMIFAFDDKRKKSAMNKKASERGRFRRSWKKEFGPEAPVPTRTVPAGQKRISQYYTKF